MPANTGTKIFADKETNNWFKAFIALNVTKEGLTNFVENTMKKVHAALGTCSSYEKAIISLHRFSGPSWKNTKRHDWKSNWWEIAKCFLPPQGYANVSSVQESDFNAVINIILNCTDFKNYLSPSRLSPPPPDPQCPLEKVRQIGRDVRHSANCKTTDAELQDYFQALTMLLVDPVYLAHDPSANTALSKLTDLQNDRLPLTELGNLVQDAMQAIGRAKDDAEDQFSEKAKHTIEESLNKIKEASNDGEIVIGKKMDESIQTLYDRTENCKIQIRDQTSKAEQTIQTKTCVSITQIDTLTKSSFQLIEDHIKDSMARMQQKAADKPREDYERGVECPSQGSTNNILSTPILPRITPSSSSNRSASDSPIADFIPSESCPVDSRPMVHNLNHFPTSSRGSLINQGQINGVSAYIGDNQDQSWAMKSDTDREPLLPSTLAETQLMSRQCREPSHMQNTNGSSSHMRESVLRIPEDLEQMDCVLSGAIPMGEDTMGVTSRSSAGELAAHEAHSSHGSRSSSKRVAELSDDVSTNNPRAGGSTINFYAPINNSVININIEGGAVRIGGEVLERSQVQILQSRPAAVRVQCNTINETVAPASKLHCNNLNKGINALMSCHENDESCQSVSKGILRNSSSLDKKELKEESCLEIKKLNNSNSDASALQGIPPRPFMRVAPMVQSNRSRQNSDDMAVSIYDSFLLRKIAFEPLSNTTQALTAEQSIRTNSSKCSSAGSMPPSTALQMEELQYWRQVSQTVPKTIDCDADKMETTVDWDANQTETTAVRPGQEELPDPVQTEWEELSDDGDYKEQIHVKHVTGIEDD